MALMRRAESAAPRRGERIQDRGLRTACLISVMARNHHVAVRQAVLLRVGVKLKRGGTRRQQGTGLAATSSSLRARLRQVDLSLSVPTVAQDDELLGGGRAEASRLQSQWPCHSLGVEHGSTRPSGRTVRRFAATRTQRDPGRSGRQRDPIRGNTRGPEGRQTRRDLLIEVLAQQDTMG